MIAWGCLYLGLLVCLFLVFFIVTASTSPNARPNRSDFTVPMFFAFLFTTGLVLIFYGAIEIFKTFGC